jgi:ribosomal protein L7Ae-like RNA K-turn-binding protein
LLRWFVGPDRTPWPDWTGRARGMSNRSAWTAADVEAITLANERGGFAKSFHEAPAKVASPVLVARALELGEKAFFNRLGLANRAGVLAVGQAAARDEFSRKKIGLVIIASDAGTSGQERFGGNARRKGIPTLLIDSGAELGRALGREFVSVTLVHQSPFSIDLLRIGRQLVALGSTHLILEEEGSAAEQAVSAEIPEGDTAPKAPSTPCS